MSKRAKGDSHQKGTNVFDMDQQQPDITFEPGEMPSAGTLFPAVGEHRGQRAIL